jgi:hypothetical protein
VTYGPFPFSLWRPGGALLCWFLAFFFLGMADVRLRIQCEGKLCSVQQSLWRRPARSFEQARLRGVKVTERKVKNGWRGQTSLHFENAPVISLETVDLDEAQVQERQLWALLDGQQQRFHYDSGDRRWMAPLAWLLALAGALAILDGLRQRRAFSLRIEGGAVTLQEPARWWGLLPSHSVPAAGATAILVRWHLLDAGSAKRPQRWGATLHMEFPHGRVEALTTIPRGGLASHYRAAEGIAQALGLRPAPLREPCPEAVLTGYEHQGAGMVVAMIWAGLCGGSLLGMALFGVILIVLDPPALDRNVDKRALVAAGVGALALAVVLARVPLGKTKELAWYRGRQGASRQGA